MHIRLEHVWKMKPESNAKRTIRSVTILSDISVEFCGECVEVILGPSGSGKTTMLRLLNKLESPSRGRIYYDDVDSDSISPRTIRKDVGMVFQVPALFRGSVFDNIAFGRQLNKQKLETKEARHYLDIVGLGKIDLERDVDSLSLGQQQRVSFARALANDPRILLLDEPTSALDPSAANNLLDLVKKINQELKIGIIMVTHALEHAQRISDLIFLLVEGRFVENRDAASFFKNPRNDVTKKFIRGEL